MKNSEACRYQALTRVLFREIDGEAVLLDAEEGTYFALNEVGTRVWKLLAEPASVDDVAGALVGEYEVDGEVVMKDVEVLMKDLLGQGLVREV